MRRTLCLSETCILERDPATYNIVTLRPLSEVSIFIAVTGGLVTWILMLHGGPQGGEMGKCFVTLRYVTAIGRLGSHPPNP